MRVLFTILACGIMVAAVIQELEGKSGPLGPSPANSDGELQRQDTVFIRGDFDCNGIVDTTDANLTFWWIFGIGDPPSCFDAVDADDDGDVDITDAELIADLSVGIVDSLPSPYPDCGPDPTPDTLDCAAHSHCMVGDVVVGDGVAPPGDTGIVVIHGRSVDTLWGYRIAIDFDESLIAVTDVDLSGTVGAWADSVSWSSDNSPGEGWVTLEVDAGLSPIEPFEDKPMAKFVFSVNPAASTPDTTALTLTDSLGPSQVVNSFVIQEDSVVYPAGRDGMFWVLDYGDADGDGEIEIEDAQVTFGWLYCDEEKPDPPTQAADANEDGSTNIADVVTIYYRDIPGTMWSQGAPRGEVSPSPEEDYGTLRIVCMGARDRGDTLSVVIVAKAGDNAIEALGIDELCYPSCLTPVDVIYFNEAYDADTAGWFYETTHGDSNIFHLGIFFSFDRDSCELLQPEVGYNSLAEIYFEISLDCPLGVYPLIMPDAKSEFSVLRGSCHEPTNVEIIDSIRVDIPSGGEASPVPRSFTLSQNYPNPFNAITEIAYHVPVDCHVQLEIYDILGQKVATVAEGEARVGHRAVIWEASDFASGIYLCRLRAGEFTAIKRMVLLK